ncbi:MAG: type I 3-dehydroquinate dehydratase [Thermoplasmata archaeon]
MKEDVSSRICVSISKTPAQEILKELRGIKMAEIRLDGANFTSEEIRELFSVPVRTIATCRPGRLRDGDRMNLLLEAIEAGAAYVDIEVNSRKSYREKIIREARRNGCKVIISYHNERFTPPDDFLLKIAERFRQMGGDILKIACRANTVSDSVRLLCLLNRLENTVVVGMGEKGKITRIAAPMMGAPFTYASLSKGKETAEGQIEFRKMVKLMDSII